MMRCWCSKVGKTSLLLEASRQLGDHVVFAMIVAAASPDGVVTFLDPARGRRRKGVGLSASAAIVNRLAWVDDASTPRRRR
jgi:molybdopterin-guanine dinucleotide biosynthesis protein